MIDLHTHVLPGIDDGAGDQEIALAMLDAQVAMGVHTVVATPHLRDDFPDVHPQEIPRRVVELHMACGASVRVLPGAEVDLAWAMAADDSTLRAVTLGMNGRDLLLETPHGPLPPFADDAIFSLLVRGFRVTLAHPELSPAFQRSPRRLAKLVRSGVILQITASSLARDSKRSGARALAASLVTDGLASVIASDTHSAGPWRPPDLASGVLAAARLVGAERASWMTTDAPAAILAGEPLTAAPGTTTSEGRHLADGARHRRSSWLRRSAA